jgi:tRNA modification GTPase
MDEDTIVALATPPGRAGIALVRLSGGKSQEIVNGLFEPLPPRWQRRKCHHGFIHSREGRIDECLLTVFEAPRSYSGEDMAEISIHSNPAIIEAVIDLACRLGARPALPGEFTYRAFRNGKLDLLQAEAVNELIQANSRVFARMEFGNLEGRLSALVGSIRSRLLQMAVAVESDIEFAEAQDLEIDGAVPGLAAAVADLERILAQSRFNEVLDRGLHVVIAGMVNVGKSSLFNALLLKERSIISDAPGTTRDYIQERLHLDGVLFQITDMAGIRSGSGDDIENQGMRLSLDRIAQADAVIFMVDASRPVQEGDRRIHLMLQGKKRILLANKKDLAAPGAATAIGREFPGETVHLLSARNGEGLQPVVDYLKSLCREAEAGAGELVVNLRQKNLLGRLLRNLKRIAAMPPRPPLPAEVIAEEIRQGLRWIGELTGAISTDDVLRGIFSTFCIGK